MGARPISVGRSSRYVPVFEWFGPMVRCSPPEKGVKCLTDGPSQEEVRGSAGTR
jgi:hypothetical protein